MASLENAVHSARVCVLPPLPYIHCAENWDEVHYNAEADVVNKRVPLHPTKIENGAEYAKICVRKPFPSLPLIHSSENWDAVNSGTYDAEAEKLLLPIPYVHSTEDWDNFNSGTYDAEAEVKNKRLLLHPAANKESNKSGRREFRRNERIRHARLKENEEAAVAVGETP